MLFFIIPAYDVKYRNRNSGSDFCTWKQPDEVPLALAYFGTCGASPYDVKQ